jgi:glutamyl-tRNA reductase
VTLLCLGLTHETSPLDILERAASSADEIAAQLANFAASRAKGTHILAELAILSTCNRVEIYAAIDEGVAPEDAHWGTLRALLGHNGALTCSELASHESRLIGADAVQHLCRVASGLESVVLGESEILRQISSAFELAKRERAAGAALGALAETALRAGRRAREETAIGRHAASLSSVAAVIASEMADEGLGARALIVGAGHMGSIAARALHARKTWDISVASRTLTRARALATRVGARALTLDELSDALAQADVVICALATPAPIIGTELLERALRERSSPPLFIDIGVPRNVHPRVRDLPGVRVLDVDALRPRINQSMSEREREIPNVEAIVVEETGQFAATLERARLLATVQELRRRAERVRQGEVQRALRESDVPVAALRPLLEQFSEALVSALLDAPSRRLRAAATNGHASAYAEFTRTVFALDEAVSEETGRHAARSARSPAPTAADTPRQRA